MKKAYLIENIEEYGKLMAFCIENDITVWRTYWDETEKGKRCYKIDFQEKRCYYSDMHYYLDNGYTIMIPIFSADSFGNIILIKEKVERTLHNELYEGAEKE